MIFFHKFLRILRIAVLIILAFTGVYFLFLREYFTAVDTAKILNYKPANYSEILDASGAHLFYLYDSQFRYFTVDSEISEKIWLLLFDADYMRKYQPKFYRENNVYSELTEDIYLTSIIKKIYDYNNTFSDKIKIVKIRKSLKESNFNLKKLLANELGFANKLFGFETAARFFFDKPLKELNDNEIIFCIANIEYFPADAINHDYVMLEKYMNLKNYIQTQASSHIKNSFVFNENNLELNIKTTHIKNNQQRILSAEYKTGINFDFIQFYIKDYLITQMNFVDLYSGGHTIKSSIDIDFLRDIEKQLKIDGAENSNKICVVSYIDENDTHYLLGIINLQFGLTVNEEVKRLQNSIKYKGKPTQFEIFAPLTITYIDIYNQKNTGIIPVINTGK